MSPRLGEVVLASQSDERLVRLARAGHERAFAEIVKRYRPQLSALARRLSPDGKAEDIVQQAFLSAFAALRSGAEVKHLRGWLYQIVRNTAARSQAPLCMPLDGATASSESVEDVVQQRALAMNALEELARLPKRQRQAMVGTALDGRGRAEVATSMGVSEGAVRQLVHRARARIRTAVTAVMPWPLVRWLAPARPGSGAAGNVAAGVGAGAASSGVALKLGIVLASGAIATGVAEVDIHGDARRPERAGPRSAARVAHRQAVRGDDQVLAVAVVARVSVHADPSQGARTTGGAAIGDRLVRVRRGGDGAADGHRQGDGGGSGRGSDRGDGGGSRLGGGTGSALGDSRGSGWDGGAGSGLRDGGESGWGGGFGSRDGGQGRDGRSFSAPQAVIASNAGSTRGGEQAGPFGSAGSGAGPGSDSGFGAGSAPGSGPGAGWDSGAGSPGSGQVGASGPGVGSGPGSGEVGSAPGSGGSSSAAGAPGG